MLLIYFPDWGRHDLAVSRSGEEEGGIVIYRGPHHLHVQIIGAHRRGFQGGLIYLSFKYIFISQMAENNSGLARWQTHCLHAHFNLGGTLRLNKGFFLETLSTALLLWSLTKCGKLCRKNMLYVGRNHAHVFASAGTYTETQHMACMFNLLLCVTRLMWWVVSVLSSPHREKKQKIQDIRKNVKDAIVVSFICITSQMCSMSLLIHRIPLQSHFTDYYTGLQSDSPHPLVFILLNACFFFFFLRL